MDPWIVLIDRRISALSSHTVWSCTASLHCPALYTLPHSTLLLANAAPYHTCFLFSWTSCPPARPLRRRVPNDAWLHGHYQYFYIALLTFFPDLSFLCNDCNCHFRLCQDDFIITAMPACQICHRVHRSAAGQDLHVWQLKCRLSVDRILQTAGQKSENYRNLACLICICIWYIWRVGNRPNLCDGRKQAWPDCTAKKIKQSVEGWHEDFCRTN